MTNWMSKDELVYAIRGDRFDPAQVEVVGAMDTRMPTLNPDALFGLPRDMWEIVVAEVNEARAEWLARNMRLFGTEYPGTNCWHCGANIRWAAIVKYLPTGQHFITGETCAEERMELGSRIAHLTRLERMGVEHREELIRIATAKATFFTEHPAEAAYLFDADRPYNDFMDQLKAKLTRYGQLSERQIACITRDVERSAQREERRAAEAAAMADVEPLAEGRREMTGEIVSTKWQDSDYGGSLKMLVKLADGNKVWGTVPSKLDTYENGTVIKFTATVERSRDDEHFGFFKRPAKAEVI